MAGDILNKYGSSGQTITCGIDSLANNALRESTVIDNTTNVFIDVLVAGKAKSGASGVSATGYVNVYAYGTVDGGTLYSGEATGSDAAYSGTTANLRWLGRFAMVANATTYNFGPFSVAAAFGGTLPQKWGVVFENKSAATLDTTAANHAVKYQGVYQQYT